MADLDKHIEKLVKKLQSQNSNDRYEACEYLRVAPQITDEAILALKNALNDSNPNVVEAAQRALEIHLPQEQTTPKNNMATSSVSGMPGNIKLIEVPPPFQPMIQPMPCSSPDSPEYVLALEKRVMMLENELRRTYEVLNQTITLSNSTIEKIPNTAILSPSFLTRAFAILGHILVAQIIILIPFYCIFFLIMSTVHR
jgi:hypothetical protein